MKRLVAVASLMLATATWTGCYYETPPRTQPRPSLPIVPGLVSSVDTHSCGSWLEVINTEVQVVRLRVANHIGCPGEYYPFSAIHPYYGDEYNVIISKDPFTFDFHAPHGGEYTYTLGSTCGTCASVTFTVPN